MQNEFSRTEMLLGEDGMKRLYGARVIIFGLGGVGGYVAEMLCRLGVGALDLVDPDEVSLTNLNRQIIATHDTVGERKAEAFKRRILSVNPRCAVKTYPLFYLPENADEIDFSPFDCIVDAIDTMTAKMEIVKRAAAKNKFVISAMGTGNKTDPLKLQVADIYETSVCPVARVMRRECKKAGIERLKVVYSKEEPIRPAPKEEGGDGRTPGSVALVPAAAGIIIASEVLKELLS